MLEGASLLLALVCAAVMGLAIQRGATCTVAAVDELLTTRRPTRLLALIEASLWATAGVLMARETGHLAMPPAAYAITPWTLVGAAVLGLGAFVGRACVFGAVARLGSGQWAFLATPLGFYLGCVSADAVFPMPAPRLSTTGSPVLALPGWWAWGLGIALVVRALWAWRLAWRHRRPKLAGPWSAHAATCVIGVAFVVLFVVAGPWAYSDVLAQLARRMAHDLPARAALGLALLGGALAGGWMTGQWRRHPLDAVHVLRCAIGGVLMGWGSLLVPGGNDGIVLLGMPLLWPFAWAAFATMVLVIGATMMTVRAVGARR